MIKISAKSTEVIANLNYFNKTFAREQHSVDWDWRVVLGLEGSIGIGG